MVNKQLFPYKEFISHPAWAVISDAIVGLQSNDDIQLETAPQYVIGYIMRKLSDGGMLAKIEKVA